jgi:putative integral membrane protein (TIGR02587 family)
MLVSGKGRPTANPAIADSLREYARGIAGGLLFGLPIIYTMEMWWAGFLGAPGRLLAGLGATFLLLILYNLYAGLRRDAGPAEILVDSVEEMGIGLLSATLLLWLAGRIDPAMPALEVIGKIVVEGLVMAIGVSIGTAQLGGRQGDEQGAVDAYRTHEPWRHLALAACGAFLFAANVAPTDEIMVLAAEARPTRLILIAAMSFATGAVILHYSDFTASVPGREAGYLAAFRVTIQSYAVALLASASLLWFFGRFADASVTSMCGQTVVLGFAGMLGASAGRLLLQPS